MAICKTWFKCLQTLFLSDFQRYGYFASLLGFEVKVRIDNAMVVLACTLAAQSWWTLPDIREPCLQQKVWCMVQEIQFDIKHALCKWYCSLFAKNGLNPCVNFFDQNNELNH